MIDDRISRSATATENWAVGITTCFCQSEHGELMVQKHNIIKLIVDRSNVISDTTHGT